MAVTPGAPWRASEDALRREGRDATPPTEPVPPAAIAVHGVCPFLVMGDGSWRSAAGLRDQRCGAVTPAAPLAIEKQRRLCVTADHLGCSTFIAADPHGVEADAAGAVRGRAAGSTRWALARTSALVLEDGAPLPLATPAADEQPGKRATAGPTTPPPRGADRAAPGGALRWPSVAELAARLEGYGYRVTDRVTAGASAWRGQVVSNLGELSARGRRLPLSVRMNAADKAGRTKAPAFGPWLSIAALRSRLDLDDRETRVGRRAPSRGPLSRIDVSGPVTARRSLPSLRLPAVALRWLDSARDAVRAGRSSASPPAVSGLRSRPSGAALRDARAAPRAPIGARRVAGTGPGPGGQLRTPMRVGGLLAAAMAVGVVAALANSRPTTDPPRAPVAAGRATGQVLGGAPPSAAPTRSAAAVELATPSQRRPTPTPEPTRTPRETYTIEAGDTLFEIAKRFDTTIADLQRLNRLESADVIEVGQVLELP